MATYLADRVIVFEGKPSIESVANAPQALLPGMNRFLELLAITFRRDPNNYRPRINKENSVKVCFQYLLITNLKFKMFFSPFWKFYRTWSRRDRAITFSWKTRKKFSLCDSSSVYGYLQSSVNCWVEKYKFCFFFPAFHRLCQQYFVIFYVSSAIFGHLLVIHNNTWSNKGGHMTQGKKRVVKLLVRDCAVAEVTL